MQKRQENKTCDNKEINLSRGHNKPQCLAPNKSFKIYETKIDITARGNRKTHNFTQMFHHLLFHNSQNMQAENQQRQRRLQQHSQQA